MTYTLGLIGIEHCPGTIYIGTLKHAGRKVDEIVFTLDCDDSYTDAAKALRVANAERMVLCWNAHDDMLEALEQAAVELEEAANVLAGSGFKSLADIYRMAAQNKTDVAAKARGEDNA